MSANQKHVGLISLEIHRAGEPGGSRPWQPAPRGLPNPRSVTLGEGPRAGPAASGPAQRRLPRGAAWVLSHREAVLTARRCSDPGHMLPGLWKRHQDCREVSVSSRLTWASRPSGSHHCAFEAHTSCERRFPNLTSRWKIFCLTVGDGIRFRSIRFRAHPTPSYNVNHVHRRTTAPPPSGSAVGGGPQTRWENKGAISLEERRHTGE